jgi:hypothetical protein
MVSINKCLAILTHALNSKGNYGTDSRDITTTSQTENLDNNGNLGDISSGSYQGVGSFYYGTNGICNGLSYSENQGYTFCESDASGPNQLTLSQRNNLNIVAIGSLTRENRAELCGKNVRVYYNGVAQGQDYVIWDKCASCGDTTLDFSIDAIQQINPNACEDGLTKNLSWEILDTNGIEFVA